LNELKKKYLKNRKQLLKRDLVIPEIYQALIAATKAGIIRYNSYTAALLKVLLYSWTITGIQVNKLLPLEIYQLKTLLAEGYIKMDRSKYGLANHKHYLSKQGKKCLLTLSFYFSIRSQQIY